MKNDGNIEDQFNADHEGETESVGDDELLSDSDVILKLLAILIVTVNSDDNTDVKFILLMRGVTYIFKRHVYSK